MQYLYGETRDPKFEYNEYYEWQAAKKEFETIFGVNAAEYVFRSQYLAILLFIALRTYISTNTACFVDSTLGWRN